MELSRDSWYVKLYFACAWLQKACLERKGSLPAPASICMMFRMYLWGVLSLMGLGVMWGIMISVVLVLVGILGFLLYGLVTLLFASGTMGDEARMTMLLIGALLIAAVIAQNLSDRFKKWFSERFPEEPKAKKPARAVKAKPSPLPRRKNPSFSVVFGEYLRNLDKRYCTPVILK